jgi:hypothetical protein
MYVTGSASLGYDPREDRYAMARHSAYAYGLIGVKPPLAKVEPEFESRWFSLVSFGGLQE